MSKSAGETAPLRKPIAWLDVPLRTFLRAKTLAVLACTALAEPIFRVLDWEWLQEATRNFVTAVLGFFVDQVTSSGTTFYTVNGAAFDMGPRCTYADLLCFTTPLLLRNRRWEVEAARLLGWWLLVLPANGIRIVAANYLRSLGLPWFWSHDLIDYLIRSVVMLLVIVGWLAFITRNDEGIARTMARRKKSVPSGKVRYRMIRYSPCERDIGILDVRSTAACD